MTTAAIIGLGHSGLRFLRACLSLKAERPTIVGICDRDERKIEALRPLFSCVLCDFRSLPQCGLIDLIVVATSESEHFDVLSFIKEHAQFRRLICEKPLTSTLFEATRLRDLLDNDDLAINFVERHSPAVETLRRYILDQQRCVVRVNFSWGKFRLKDPRPTLGVISELCHPMDLALFLADVPPDTQFEIVSASAVASDFAVGARAFDSMTICIRFGSGLLVTGLSSYVRSGRERHIEVFLADRNRNVRELAAIRFDNPSWDDDHLQVFDVHSTDARPPLVLEYRTGSPGTRARTRSIEKISRFVSLNVAEIHGVHSSDLAKLRQAVYVQQVLDAAATVAARHRASFGSFVGEPRASETSIEQKLEFIRRLVTGEEIPAHAFVWDDGY